MSSFQKNIAILSLFTNTRRQLSAAAIAELAGLPIATCYRYLQNLQAAGLVVQTRPTVFVLGPRIAELDRLMRISDPLLVASDAIFRECLMRLGETALQLNRYAGNNCVLCIRAEVGWDVRDPSRRPFLRERGVPYSLLQGAGSIAILAWKPERVIAEAFSSNPDFVRAVGMGSSLPEFQRHLSKVRRTGHAISVNIAGTGRTSLAIPLTWAGLPVEASIARTMDTSLFETIGEAAVLADLRDIEERFKSGLAVEADAGCPPS